MDFYQGCVLVAVLAFLVLVIFAVRALIQIVHTAEAVEYLAISAAEKVDKTQSTFALLDNISSFLDSGMVNMLKTAIGFARRLRKDK